MNTLIDTFVGKTVQCWSCPIFDRLFQVISAAAAAIYDKMALLAAVLLSVFVAFYVLYAVLQNLKSDDIDPTYQKYFKPVMINSLVVIAILGLGVMVPRFITTITFEPVADMTLVYTHSMLNTEEGKVSEKVVYRTEQMPDNGFYRPELRDRIVLLMKTSITQFQAMMKMGMVIVDHSLTWKALWPVSNLIKHIMLFFMGLFIVWSFFRLFIKFCFYFVDVIIDLTFFAFFFPIMLVFFVIQNAQFGESAKWVKSIGTAIVGEKGYFRNVINSIVSLATVVITYVVIMTIVAKFFSSPGADSAALAKGIMDGSVFAGDLEGDNLAMVTLGGVIVLIYVVQYLADHIGDVAKEIHKTFNIEERHPIGDKLGEDALKIGQNTFDFAKKTGTILWNAATGKEPEKKAEDGDKKEAKSGTEEKK
ncbi:MAG: hypothetical protein FWF97_01110 [Alphaproteobacteria bacterium]|nr:hypothetical protein [Alphaproteobacteria bacterium]